MKKLVIVPGGFHPWHGGHSSLYSAAKETFPSADVFVASTDDTSERPFPFKIKKILAQAAGVPANRFIQVRSPFRAQEITQMYDPETTELIFVRSEKDRDEQPQPGGIKKNGDASYLQPYKRSGRSSFNKHAYMAYLPVQQFGGGLTSATEIRNKWPRLSADKKLALVKELYPTVVDNEAAAAKLVQILDSVMPVQEVTEADDRLASFFNTKPTSAKLRMIWPGLDDHEKLELIQHLYGRVRPLDPLRAQQMVDHANAVITNAKPDHGVMPESGKVNANAFDYIDEIKL